MTAIIGHSSITTTDFVRITDRTIYSTSSSVKAFTGIKFLSDGRLQKAEPTSYVDIAGEWYVGSDPLNPADYEIRATLINGFTPSAGSMGVWLSMSSDREWRINDTSDNELPQSSLILFEMRDAVTLGILESAQIRITDEMT